jgi:hypothetical protein
MSAKLWLDISLISAPAAKAFYPLPVRTAQRWLSSASNLPKASIKSANI